MVDVERLAKMTAPDRAVFTRFLFTKYSHWKYEEEIRAIVHLKQRDGDLYFKEFGDDLRLRVWSSAQDPE